MEQIPCNNCGGKIDVPSPRLELVNQYTVSMIVWAHGEPVACANCGAVVVGLIPEIPINHMKMSYTPLPPESMPKGMKVQQQQKSRIIIPFS